jgi:hypothetical protein
MLVLVLVMALASCKVVLDASILFSIQVNSDESCDAGYFKVFATGNKNHILLKKIAVNSEPVEIIYIWDTKEIFNSLKVVVYNRNGRKVDFKIIPVTEDFVDAFLNIKMDADGVCRIM